MSGNIIVIGAGIIGLTSALKIQSTLGPKTKITIIAREFPSDESLNYSSPWAGAHYRPVPEVDEQSRIEATWCLKTLAVLKQQALDEPEAGIIFLPGYEYFEKPPERYVDLKGRYVEHEGFRVLEKDELPKGVKLGVTYLSWCINPPVYCAHLLRKFILRGGKTMKYTLGSAEEAFSILEGVVAVINCSGYGFGDKDVVITRGQTCIVSNPCDRTITQQNADGTWAFLVPRPLNGGTIVGGTKEVGDWNPKAEESTRSRLLENAAKMYPDILNEEGEFDIIRDIVGRRPTRKGGMRLEIENVGKGKLCHAYGAGGSGYEFSWGIADEVVKRLLKEL